MAGHQAGYPPAMKQTDSRDALDDTDPRAGGWRRIAVTAGLVLVGLILILVAIYAGAFLILAPMMQ